MPCDAIAQTGCSAGARCAFVYNQGVAEARCVAVGTLATFAPCADVDAGAGFVGDNCAAGDVCSADGCGRACSLAQPSCPALTACVTTTSLEPLGVGTCVRTCDIVTQRRLLDNAQACGSASPASPNRGCYLNRGVFVCAPAGGAANTHRVVPNRNFSNSCAPGFQQLLVETTGSTVEVCVATCAPTETSTAQPSNAGGVAPSTCASRGAPGADCKFGWSVQPTTTPGANGWGYCFDPEFYFWDHDQNPSSPQVAQPRCASLPTTDTDGNSQPDHRQWGCAPLP